MKSSTLSMATLLHGPAVQGGLGLSPTGEFCAINDFSCVLTFFDMFVAILSSSLALYTSECLIDTFVTLPKPFASSVHHFTPPTCSGESGAFGHLYLHVLVLFGALGMSLYLLDIFVWLPMPSSHDNSTHSVHRPVSGCTRYTPLSRAADARTHACSAIVTI